MGNKSSIWFAARQAPAAASPTSLSESTLPLDDEVEQVYDAAAQLFAVLSCATRLAILCQLRCRGLAVRQVAKSCGISQPCASTQLKMLWQWGLLQRERRGREVVYALKPSPLLEGLCDVAWDFDEVEEQAAVDRRAKGASR